MIPAVIKDTLYELMKKYDGKDRFYYLAAVGNRCRPSRREAARKRHP